MHEEKVYNLYLLLNIIVIKSKRMKWTAHAAYRGSKKYIQNSGRKNRRKRKHFEDLGLDDRIILKRI
jgi:hypothetical protein